MNSLDFLIIGAQKCATTTLFELLRKHNDITMPLEKEVPFFIEDAANEQRWEQFATSHFPAEKSGLWGKATPQYMCDGRSAARIQSLMPGVKLIAILRDPVARTRSHFKMNKRRGLETRSIDDAIAPLLSASASTLARSRPVPRHTDGFESESAFYIAWSEYGAALKPFYDVFDSTQILVLYTEELEADPAGTLDRVLTFLELAPGYRPRELGKVIHQGGGSQRIPHSMRLRLRSSWLYRIWRRLPPPYQGRLRFLYDQWNTRRAKPDEDWPTSLTLHALRLHFARDLQALMALATRRPPWVDSYTPVMDTP